MVKYNTSDVYTPSSPAKITFVERTSLNDLLIDAIHTKGKQIVIYGHTGTGKSTLLINKLNQTYDDYIVTRCTSDISFEHIILAAFDKLEKYVTDTSSTEKGKKIALDVGKEFKIVKAGLGIEVSNKVSQTYKRIVPPQLTPQRLAAIFGLTNSCWVIDDFHKLPKEEKQHLAQWMKVFMDESVNFPYVKIIVIGAVSKANEVIKLDKELNNRVTEIHVPFMNEIELKEIIERGEIKLNIHISEEAKKKIISFSTGLPSIAHQLCLNLCLSKGLYETADYRVTFDLNDFNDAITRFIQQNSSYLSDRYESAIREKNDKDFMIHYHILRAFVLNKKHNLNIDDVVKYFKDHLHPQQTQGLIYLLNQLTKDARGNALKYDEDSETWAMSDPFFKVFCLCIMDLKKTTIQAQMELFNEESIKKSKKKIDDQQKDLVKQILKSGEHFDF